MTIFIVGGGIMDLWLAGLTLASLISALVIVPRQRDNFVLDGGTVLPRYRHGDCRYLLGKDHQCRIGHVTVAHVCVQWL